MDAGTFAGLMWPNGERIGSLDGFLAGPPETKAGLLEYAAALAGLTPMQIAEDAELAAAGVVKVFHRRRISKWAVSLVGRDS